MEIQFEQFFQNYDNLFLLREVQIEDEQKNVLLLSISTQVLNTFIIYICKKQMKSINQDDTIVDHPSQEIQGTTIITVMPQKNDPFSSPNNKKGRKKSQARRQRLPKIINDYNQQPESQIPDEDRKQAERGSQGKMKGVDQETAGQYQQNGLITPYQFLTQRTPSIRKIFFPRMAVKTVTFVLSIIYIVAFLILIGYNYSKQQTSITWNCSLYQLQNKYFPRLNNKYQIWRIFISAFFHSNIAHFFLDLFAIQIYGYFVEWYYGLKNYLITIVASIVYSHVFAAAVQKTSVSTTSSAIFMSVAALKIYFLWQYRNYRKLYDRRSFLYILLVLIIGINFIPIFVVNNVDFSAHLGGLIVGGLLGLYFHKKKVQQPSRMDSVLKWGSLIILFGSFIGIIALIFSDTNSDNAYLASQIETQCQRNSP